MDTKELQIFIQIASTHSITRAAEKFGMSQPAVSSVLKRIEDELGYALFIRKGKQLQLSEQGKLFYDMAKDMTDSFVHVANSLRGGYHKKAEIVINFRTRSDKIFPVMNSFQRLRPDICFVLKNGAANRDNYRGSADFDIVFMQDIMDEEFADLDLCSTLYAVVSREHHLAKHGLLELPQLMHEHFIFLRGANGDGYEDTYNECINLGIVPRIMLATDSHLTKYAAIRNGMGIGLVYGHELSMAPYIGDCKVVLVNARLTARSICIAWNSALLSEAGRAFTAFIQQYR